MDNSTSPAAAAATADIELMIKSIADDHFLRRIISNRESARRSRTRKKRHLERLLSRIGWLRRENSELAERIVAFSGSCIHLRHENEQFKAESAALCLRLSQIRKLLFLRQLDCLSFPPAISSASSSGGGFTRHFDSANEQIHASLIT